MNIIRADGNSVIGMGHIMRCLAIADAMEDKPVFVTACEECGKLIQERGYRVSVLPTDYREMESELSDLEKIVVKERSLAGEKPVLAVFPYLTSPFSTSTSGRSFRKRSCASARSLVPIPHPLFSASTLKLISACDHMVLTLRQVEPEDLELLYCWANEPTTRQNAFHMDRTPHLSPVPPF